MTEKQQYLGPTDPLSTAFSSQSDIQLTLQLEETLTQYGMYDSEEREIQRKRVLQLLDRIVKDFVQDISIKRGLSQMEVARAGGMIATYGSYRLGVNASDADIDTLCVFPRHVSREDFFSNLLPLLEANDNIQDVTPVVDSFVPVIKFRYRDIHIDLVCARLDSSYVPDNINLNDPDIFRNLDERSIRSLNGTRVADDILRLVPNVDVFRTVLRCIKLWATTKGIYSNVLGFMGGIAWAILVARVCQLYPNACASTVISKFFNIVISWKWPSPVFINTASDGPPTPIKPWNPKVNLIDRQHRMPVITPSYPSMCATHNITSSTQKIIIGESKMAAEIVSKIMTGTAKWSALFQPHTFFDNYDHYLQIIVSSDNYKDQLYWSRLVEARLRHLLIKLESVPPVVLVHPFVDGFDKTHICKNLDEISTVVHGRDILVKNTESNHTKMIYTKTFYVGLYVKIRPDEEEKIVDLAGPIHDFKQRVRSWPMYDHRHMGIDVEYLRKEMLPKDLFEHNKVNPLIIIKRERSMSFYVIT
ncbi:Poly(A) polymerase central domain-containing protein [Pilobolus umbonatus]|nr:Poly(A) polymerase central domain-containing protein [Pilobolus umbonatus]